MHGAPCLPYAAACVPSAPWLSDVHDLSVEELGYASIVIGAAEIVGEVVVIVIGDRISTLLLWPRDVRVLPET